MLYDTKIGKIQDFYKVFCKNLYDLFYPADYFLYFW